jgi:hypothetical protein
MYTDTLEVISKVILYPAFGGEGGVCELGGTPNPAKNLRFLDFPPLLK